MTPQHEELHNKINIEHNYIPNIFIFQFLNGVSEEEKFVSWGYMAYLVIVAYIHLESRYNLDCIGLDTISLPSLNRYQTY